ncbi:MAG TPA: ankyrin repeat domain-containing protein [Alphaproteobacteria bacterium]|nr:hypothetical protein [Rhodospirillaceae bacterium]HRJ65607.1 ankyrin repeat domain-containing protein [Alphaproteobacteria bacterium]
MPPRTYETVIAALSAHNPPAVVKNNDSRPEKRILADALVAACKEGDLDAVRQLHQSGAKDNSCVIRAARNNHLHIVEYLQSQGITHPNALHEACNGRAKETARYLYEQQEGKAKLSLPAAAAGGLLEAVIHAYKNLGQQKTPWQDIENGKRQALLIAAEDDDIGIINYLYGKGVRHPLAIVSAAANGALEAARFFYKQPECQPNIEDAMISAVKSGQTNIVKFLHGQGVEISKHIQALISNHNNIELLVHLEDNGVHLFDSIGHPLRKKETDGWRLWQRLHQCAPEGIESLSPYRYKPKAFNDCTEMLVAEGYSHRAAHRYAYHAAALFGSTERILTYLEKWGQPGKQPLHDLLYPIDSLPTGKMNMTAWADAILRHGTKMAKLLKFAADIQEPAKDPNGQWSYTKTVTLVARNAYKRAAEHPGLAALCFSRPCPESQFNTALEVATAYADTYGSADAAKPGTHIPDIRISGEDFGKRGYTFAKLPDGDVRGLLLGEFTDCCQSICGNGHDCAVHGFLSPQGGFYALTDEKSGNIVAQSWAWRGTKGELVLDSLESLKGHMDKEQWTSLCTAFAHSALSRTESAISGVHIGTGGATPEKMPFPQTSTPAVPLDYAAHMHRDSAQQYVVQVPRAQNR